MLALAQPTDGQAPQGRVVRREAPRPVALDQLAPGLFGLSLWEPPPIVLADATLEPGVDHLARRLLAANEERRAQRVMSDDQVAPCHPERTDVKRAPRRPDDHLLHVEPLARGGEAVVKQSDLQWRGAMLGRDRQDPYTCAVLMRSTASPRSAGFEAPDQSSVMVHAIPEVSVVIPTRNRWGLLSRSGLAAALVQKDVDLEIIVVDDGSTDETPVRLAALDNPRVRVIRHDQRQGVARARNRGVAEAQSEWVAFLDDDDLWSPDKLRRQLDLATTSSAGFVYGAAVVLDDRRKVLKLLASPKPKELAGRLTRANIVPGGQSNVMARTDVVRQLGGFDERLSLIADWDMWIRLANAERAAASVDVLVGYVLHGEAMQARLSEPAGAEEFAYLASKHRIVGARSSTAELLTAQWRASVYRRAGRRLRAAQEYLRSAVVHRNVGMLVRGIAILFGEWAMRLGPGYTAARGMRRPDWLSLYGDRDRARD